MASFTVPCPKASSAAARIAAPNSNQYQQLRVARIQYPIRKQSTVGKVQARLNEVTVEKSSNSVPVPVSATKPGLGLSEAKNEPAEKTPSLYKVPDASSLSAFMTQVSDLVKLVDSRDIAELKLKQLDCEIVIRKKEALQQPAVQVPMFPPPAYATLPSPPSTVATAAPATYVHSAPAQASPAPAKTSTPSHPPLKSPMAGTFYRCPAPGEPPFVKVGDKVQKGQVICIIEAMKLMNEIEADQSGTVTEVLAEDGKPVSLDMPLVVIVP